jgi:hypothetical protein
MIVGLALRFEDQRLVITWQRNLYLNVESKSPVPLAMKLDCKVFMSIAKTLRMVWLAVFINYGKETGSGTWDSPNLIEWPQCGSSDLLVATFRKSLDCAEDHDGGSSAGWLIS